MAKKESGRFVSRGGDKLDAAIQAFGVEPQGLVCADLGCNVGGFTDCLLQYGASKVYAIDTGYGELAWTLRKDPRVVVMERTNALHVQLPEKVSLVSVDVAWTRQHLILPAALDLLEPGGKVVTLIKTHYEAEKSELKRGILASENVDQVLDIVRQRLEIAGINLKDMIESPIRGRKGNREFLALIVP